MARIRTVKPEFFTHPEIVRLSIPARLLLVSLLTQADDEGRLYDQPKRIGANAFGEGDRVSPERLLSELAGEGRIVRYEAAGRRCIAVQNFSRHQTISHPKASVIPPCGFQELSGNDPGSLQSGMEQGTGNREGNRESIPPPAEESRNGRKLTDEQIAVRASIKDAIVAGLHWNPAILTPRTWKRVEVVAKEFHEAGFTVEDVELVGVMSAEHWPDADRTPETLLKAVPHIERWRAERKVVRR